MKKSIFSFLLIIIMVFIISGLYLAYKINEDQSSSLDIIVVNDITESIKDSWNSLESMSVLPGTEYGLDYLVVDSDNNLRVKTSEWLNTDINSAISHRDTIVDIYNNNELLGKLIIYNDYNESLQLHRINIYKTCFIIISISIIICIIFAYYIYIVIYRPFNKLQGFAKNVAAGDLEVPLEMDKKNIFGAFTESFDIMREELKSARQAERQANKSKKELVASLSHDIKTPVASIKAVSELLVAKAVSEKEISTNYLHHLDTIGQKADQINTLITNMFNATLEELQELKVEVTEQSSLVIYDIISSADYFNKIEDVHIEECLIYADINRLTQVIDNIISNSYKYAGTNIELNSFCEDEYMIIEFIDFGNGVNKDEISLLFNKFYRAKNSEGKSGTGLGLYISHYLMDKMQGDIMCENINNGFKVILMIKLV